MPDARRDRLLGALAVAAAASIWGTLGLFAKILYAQGVSFEALVAVRACVGWLAVLLFLLMMRGAGTLRVARAGTSHFSRLWGSSGSAFSTFCTSTRCARAPLARPRYCSTAPPPSWSSWRGCS